MGTESFTTTRNHANRAVLPAKNGLSVIINNPTERNRFLRFAVVGIIGAVVDFGTFNLLVTFTAIAAIWASIISFTAAVTSNFLWNRYWTYPDSRAKSISRQVVQFLVVSFVGLGIRTPLFAWLEETLYVFFTRTLPAGFFLSPKFLGHNFALATAVFVVMMWNFFANRYWTYNDVSS